MERGKCCAVYIDHRVERERCVSKKPAQTQGDVTSEELCSLPLDESVYLCNSGKSFASKLASLRESSRGSFNPVFAFIDITVKGDVESIHRRSISPTPTQHILPQPELQQFARRLTFSSESEELYGFQLLSRFSTDIQAPERPNVIIPIAVLRNADDEPNTQQSSQGLLGTYQPRRPIKPDERQITRCLDAGAVDVLVCPMEESTVQPLLIHAYHANKMAQKENLRFLTDQKLRKQSWVGADDEKPYAYLREAMVSKLMKRICNPEEVLEDSPISNIRIVDDRKRAVETAVAEWSFSAHDFSDDELAYAACVMFEHAFKMPELEKWKIGTEELTAFVLSCRAAYNSFILYHNFRHAIDVLQSTFHFLVRLGVLAPFPEGADEYATGTGMTHILTAFDGLTLLVTALGHDVGHPGVNNGFLVRLNAPLAQLYNDRSVLEAFHCAAYSQILRRHWPTVFGDASLRTLMISAILATDMGIHNKFMESLTQIRERFQHDGRKVTTWSAQEIKEYRVLLCALIIKCADISNVSRPFSVAEKWTDVLQLEFANQGDMESNMGIETAIFGGPPEIGNFIQKAKGQIGFMDIFALPLFDGVTYILPDMAFAVNSIRRNRFIWDKLIEHEELMASHKSRGCDTPRCQNPKSTFQDYRQRLETSNPDAILHSLERLEKDRSSSATAAAEFGQLDGASGDEGDGGTVTNAGDGHPSICASSRTEILPPTNDTPTGDVHTENQTEGKDCGSFSTVMNGRQAESRRVNGHKQFQRSAGRSSTPAIFNRTNDSCGGSGGGGVRTQSTSTYTNNTLMTPLSSTTQASSVISGGSSGDEKDSSRYPYRHQNGDDVSHSYASSLADGAGNSKSSDRQHKLVSALPNTDGAGHVYRQRQPHHWYDRNQGRDKTSKFMSTLFDKRFGNNPNNTSNGGFAVKPPRSAPSTSDPGPRMPRPSPSIPNLSSSAPPTDNVSTPLHNKPGTLPHRRSRLRLAFWRKNKHSMSPTSDRAAVTKNLPSSPDHP
ncbi:3',5'-cyclic-nucleotide phosphodiesterase [Myotisia sp. PD_48]|nr:3',5'-cyclic-nucleotide phosphodiesterase [Myotisia sp. PD_48]